MAMANGQMYKSFEEGVRRLVHGLNIDDPKITKQKLETPRIGADYVARITGHIKTDYLFEDIEVTADLHVKIETDSDDLSEWTFLRYLLSIWNQLGIVHFHKFDFFRRDENPPLIWEWVADAVHEFNLKKIRDGLGFMLGDYPPSGALGEWGSTYEFDAILKGLIAFGVDDIIIYKMRHVDETGFQSYSYAVLFFNRWIIFPHFAGTASGGASLNLNYINQVIEDVKTQSRIHLIEFDIDYQDLVEKTKEYTPTFLVKKDFIESISDEIKGVKLPEDIREKYLMEIEAINDAISKGYYPHALRDLRALIEDGGRYLYRLLNIPLPEKATKKHIVPALVTNKIIEPRLDSCFDAFYTFGSKGAHGVSLDDLDIIEKQKMVQVSLLLGKTLLLEILRKIEERSSTNHDYRLPHPSQFSSLFNRG